MIMFKSVAELEAALRAAEAAHKLEETNLCDPHNWPLFYAHFMAAGATPEHVNLVTTVATGSDNYPQLRTRLWFAAGGFLFVWFWLFLLAY